MKQPSLKLSDRSMVEVLSPVHVDATAPAYIQIQEQVRDRVRWAVWADVWEQACEDIQKES